jgi:hypothetical protein
MPSPAPPVMPRLQGGAPPALYPDKARQGGLVAILSERHVGRLLQSGRAHKSRCGLHAEPDAAAAAQMADLTTRYAQAPAIGNIGNACERVLSTDVMPRHPSPGAPPSRQAHGPWARGATRVRSYLTWHGDVDRQYRRGAGHRRGAVHGPATPGRGLYASQGPHGALHPRGDPAALCRRQSQLASTEKFGVLDGRSMVTRAAFLAVPRYRIMFHYAPKQVSWLNQLERWFRM